MNSTWLRAPQRALAILLAMGVALAAGLWAVAPAQAVTATWTLAQAATVPAFTETTWNVTPTLSTGSTTDATVEIYNTTRDEPVANLPVQTFTGGTVTPVVLPAAKMKNSGDTFRFTFSPKNPDDASFVASAVVSLTQVFAAFTFNQGSTKAYGTTTVTGTALAGGVPVEGLPVTFTTAAAVPGTTFPTAMTDENGTVTFTFTAREVGGPYAERLQGNVAGFSLFATQVNRLRTLTASQVTVLPEPSPVSRALGAPAIITPTMDPSTPPLAAGDTITALRNGVEVGTATVVAVNGVLQAPITISGPATIGLEQLTLRYTSRTTPASLFANDVLQDVTWTPGVTRTALTLSKNPVTSSETATATATVSTDSGLPLDGDVHFVIDGLTHIVAVADGEATLSLPALAVGNHPITASFVPRTTSLAESSDSSDLAVVATPSTTRVAATPDGAPSGTAVTLRATVTSAGSPLTGTVTFSAGGQTIGTATVANGSATLTTNVLPVGDTTVTASFRGNDSVLGSEGSTSVRVVAVPAEPTYTSGVSGVLSASSATVGGAVSYTATVTVSVEGDSNVEAPAAQGSVIFSIDGVDVGAPVAVVAGKAVFSVPTTAAGTYRVTARFLSSLDTVPDAAVPAASVLTVTAAITPSPQPSTTPTPEPTTTPTPEPSTTPTPEPSAPTTSTPAPSQSTPAPQPSAPTSSPLGTPTTPALATTGTDASGVIGAGLLAAALVAVGALIVARRRTRA